MRKILLLAVLVGCTPAEYGPGDDFSYHPQDVEQCEAQPDTPWCEDDSTDN